MIFEHFAINTKDPHAIRDWYCANLGMKVVFEMKEAPFMIFLADSSDRVVCELYHRPDQPITDFSTQHQLTFHFAFVSENAEADKDRLVNAGASFAEDVKTDNGSHLIMLRDPWGLPLQLCQRTEKLSV